MLTVHYQGGPQRSGGHIYEIQAAITQNSSLGSFMTAAYHPVNEGMPALEDPPPLSAAVSPKRRHPILQEAGLKGTSTKAGGKVSIP